MIAYIAAALVHLVIIGAVVFNYTVKRDTVEAFDAEKIDTVNASVIDDRKLQEDIKEIKEKDRKKAEKERKERERLEKLKRDAEKEEKRIEDLKEKAKDEKKKAEELEKERKAIALKKKKELEAENKRKAEEKKRKEAAEKERKKKAEAKRKKDAAAAEKKRQEDADRQRLSDKLAAEEEAKKQQQADRRAGERTATLVNQFFARIRQKIEIKRTIDPSFEIWRKSVVEIKVSPSGRVQSVRTIESSGLSRYDKQAESAVYAASPLPMPDENQDPEAVRKLLTFELVMKHPNAR